MKEESMFMVEAVQELEEYSLPARFGLTSQFAFRSVDALASPCTDHISVYRLAVSKIEMPRASLS